VWRLKSKEELLNTANKLTMFRIILIPAFLVVLYIGFTGSRYVAMGIFIIAGLTDIADGYIARRRNQVTDFGKLMDPLADKFLVIGALIAITASEHFTEIRLAAGILTAVVLFRELGITSIRLVAKSTKKKVIAANFVGKLKTTVQIVCVMTILLEYVLITLPLKLLLDINLPSAYILGYATMAVMLVVTVYSGYVYVKLYRNYIDPTE
jgi:CDP-diacylglycerol--glycerol-3-phosphate 3-phosphatidyltransferase